MKQISDFESNEISAYGFFNINLTTVISVSILNVCNSAILNLHIKSVLPGLLPLVTFKFIII